MHLYLHVPFCARRCSYCDFAIAVRKRVPGAEYADAVLAEWESWLDHPAWQDSPVVETIYLGGGTPSLLHPGALEQLLDRFRRDRSIAGDVEITLEANPDDVTLERAREWRRQGINRVSLGAQSFDPAVLRWMHRTHTAGDIPRAAGLLREAGIANLSLDLIFGLGPEPLRDWPADLEQALALEPAHISAYGLTVEPRTPLARWVQRGTGAVADEESCADEFVETHQRLTAAGFEHYEVSNYARHGSRSRHNSAYWQRRPFIGLGPSAHSGFTRHRRWNLRYWAQYQAAASAGRSVVEGEETLSDWQQELEDRYLGLRTDAGLARERLPDELRGRWITAGWAREEADRLVLTVEGWLRLDALVAAAGDRPLAPNLRS